MVSSTEALVVRLSKGALVAGSSPELARRTVTSDAVCIPEFGWMNNSLSQPPCIVAGYLLSACVQAGDWTVPAVTATSHYTPPDSRTANACECSWAVYNTLQACAFCQGENYESAMLSWIGWSGKCSSDYLSDTDYYPSYVPIPDGTAIPFWAIKNPAIWKNGEFDPTAAQGFANKNKSDVTESNRRGSRKHTVDAIAGGAAGCAVFVAVLGLLSYFIARRIRIHRPPASAQLDNQFPPLRQPPSMGNMANRGLCNSIFSSLRPTPPVSIDSTGNAFARSRSTLFSWPARGSFISFSALSTAHAAGTDAGVARPGHARTRSGSSTLSVGAAVGEECVPPEGAIVPFVLPPLLPEPMGPDVGGTKGDGGARGNGNGNGNGSGVSGGGEAAGGGEARFSSAARKAARRNPPAYAPILAPDHAGTATAMRDSVEVQAAGSESRTRTLSDSTLQQSPSGM